LTPGSGMGRILESQHPDPDPGWTTRIIIFSA
jgi:hypothetical protein